MTDNTAPFKDPRCTCEKFFGSAGMQVIEISPTCELHGEGTDYWKGMTAERERIAREMGET